MSRPGLPLAMIRRCELAERLRKRKNTRRGAHALASSLRESNKRPAAKAIDTIMSSEAHDAIKKIPKFLENFAVQPESDIVGLYAVPKPPGERVTISRGVCRPSHPPLHICRLLANA